MRVTHIGQTWIVSSFQLNLLGRLPFTKPKVLHLNDISEKAAGLTYVFLTRVRSLSNLIIEPILYERLTSLKKSSSYKYRVLEEIRLKKIE